jgi:hypothetical protein
MRPLALPCLLAAVCLALAACGGSDDGLPKSTVAVIGDMPYGTSPTDTSEFVANPAFIAAINADSDVSLVLHVGDIHSGKEYCTNAYDQAILSQWKAFADPLVYTPGDNEWADCHKVKEGGGAYNATTGAIDYVKDASGNPVDYANGDPAANLALVRTTFFPAPGQSQGAAMAVHSQAQEFDAVFPSDKKYIENVWWEKSGVLFVTLNLPGGSNNDTDVWFGVPTMSAAQSQEVAERSAANLRWLDTAFKRAAANGDIAVVIQLQADMWDLDGAASAAHLSQYKQFIDSIASHATPFAKPVLLFNGDSHVFRSDNPLQPGSPCAIEPSSGAAAVACSVSSVPSTYGNVDPYLNQPNGYNVPNFRRITVHGSTFPFEFLKLAIDPAANAANGTNAFGPFSWTRVKP